jgi:hypothetical protein
MVMARAKPLNTKKLIRPGDFVEVCTDNLVEDDILRGDQFYVANMQSFPVSKEDLYMQRLLILGHKVQPDYKLDTTQLVTIDPGNLKKLPKAKQKFLYSQVEAHYLPQPEGV